MKLLILLPIIIVSIVTIHYGDAKKYSPHESHNVYLRSKEHSHRHPHHHDHGHRHHHRVVKHTHVVVKKPKILLHSHSGKKVKIIIPSHPHKMHGHKKSKQNGRIKVMSTKYRAEKPHVEEPIPHQFYEQSPHHYYYDGLLLHNEHNFKNQFHDGVAYPSQYYNPSTESPFEVQVKHNKYHSQIEEATASAVSANQEHHEYLNHVPEKHSSSNHKQRPSSTSHEAHKHNKFHHSNSHSNNDNYAGIYDQYMHHDHQHQEQKVHQHVKDTFPSNNFQYSDHYPSSVKDSSLHFPAHQLHQDKQNTHSHHHYVHSGGHAPSRGQNAQRHHHKQHAEFSEYFPYQNSLKTQKHQQQQQQSDNYQGHQVNIAGEGETASSRPQQIFQSEIAELSPYTSYVDHYAAETQSNQQYGETHALHAQETKTPNEAKVEKQPHEDVWQYSWRGKPSKKSKAYAFVKLHVGNEKPLEC